MNGIVNKAIHGLVTENFGEEAWNDFKKDSRIEIDYFLSNESHDDTVTFKLATTATPVLNMPLQDILIAFGYYWVFNLGQKHSGTLMKAGWNNAKDFIINLPHFHSCASIINPKLTPPEFNIIEMGENKLHLHFDSKRNGLTCFFKTCFRDR